MKIPAYQIPLYVPLEQVNCRIRFQRGDLVRELTREELHFLIMQRDPVLLCATVRGKRVTALELQVPIAVAFRRLGEKNRKQSRGVFHSDASDTTRRIWLNGLAPVIAHHAAHCSAWNPRAVPVNQDCV